MPISTFNPSKALKKYVVGHKIVRVSLNRFPSLNHFGKGRDWAFNPNIVLDNGASLWFNTQETQTGDYGTNVIVIVPETLLDKEDHE